MPTERPIQALHTELKTRFPNKEREIIDLCSQIEFMVNIKVRKWTK